MKQINYHSGFKYQLTQSFSIKLSIKPEKDIETKYIILDTYGWLYIDQGYAWDGPSGPMLDTKSAMRGSLIHDAYYQLMRLGLLNTKFRVEADAIFKNICLEDGMSRFRAWYAFRGLQIAHGAAALPSHRRKEHTAP